MNKLQILKSVLVGGASVLALANPAAAKIFNIPDGDLAVALGAYMRQSGIDIVYLDDVVRGHRSRGAKGELTETAALTEILQGTGFKAETMPSNAIGIVPQKVESVRVAQARRAPAAPMAAAPAAVETVVVTAQKKTENIQNVPIAVTALSQAQLTERQVAGGPDLIKEIPNLTFTKTNFTGYSINIRGIGTEAISVTTDPAVAVALNGTPFIRNHFFEQEFFDLADVEVLRGPQGTLFGRNATAGVVNLKSALPTDQFEAMASADLGNYSNRRLEGMVNLPIVGDKLDLRIAGEWTKRDGYSFDTLTNKSIDGRDLWSGRVTLGWKPVSSVQTYFVWEHFSEDDNRMRTAKQLCKRDNGPATVLGQSTAVGPDGQLGQEYLSQGCLPGSLYSPDAFGVPNALSLPYYGGFLGAGFGQSIANPLDFPGGLRDAYASTTQSTNLRNIESALTPQYKAKNDTLELNAEWQATSWLTVNSQTGYNRDFLWSIEDYNRFNTQPGIFNATFTELPPSEQGLPASFLSPDGNYRCYDGSLSVGGNHCTIPYGDVPTAYFCDPQLGCSNRLVGEDLSDEHAWQLSQELRLASDFSGPFNFSLGGNYLHYETEENYYVFINTITAYSAVQNSSCLNNGYQFANPRVPSSPEGCLGYIDPNPIGGLNNQGHNYFLSQNPYVVNSYGLFGEAYYNLTENIKLTEGLRWTVDDKHFTDIPSELLTNGFGYPATGVVNQKWSEWTGRSVASWTPTLSFTDQSMFYASYAHGYKAGGANPPGAVLLSFNSGDITNPIHPLTFKPEHIEAFELGTKNAVLGDTLTLNGDIFYYNYHGYQISRIVDRSAINDNFNAHVAGAEMESTWEPLPGLRFNLAAGFEDAEAGRGQSSIDLMDRTAGNPNWLVVKPFPTQASNCVLPAYVVAYLLENNSYSIPGRCGVAYQEGLDPVTNQPYGVGLSAYPGYPGFNPATAPNGGQGFDKNLSGNRLPGAPPVTLSFGTQYTMPVSSNWAATLRGDFYWQDDSWARIFNDNPYDRLRGYTNLNLALILDSGDGWQVMGYVKNVFNVTAITGDFLNSDDSGLTTNVFLTDPRLYGVRVTKNFGEGDTGAVADVENYIADIFADTDNGRPPLWIELGGGFVQLDNVQQSYSPPFAALIPDTLPSPQKAEKTPATAFDSEGKISYQPESSDWVLTAAIRYGRSASNKHVHKSLPPSQVPDPKYSRYHSRFPTLKPYISANIKNFIDIQSTASEQHSILDFTAGKDVGLGMFDGTGTSTIGGGVRVARFTAHVAAEANTDPNYVFSDPKYAKNYHDVFDGTTKLKRSFHGIGPELTWDASQPILGNADEGRIAVDWGLNGAVLFGRQTVKIDHRTSAVHCGAGVGGFGEVTNNCHPLYAPRTQTISRSRQVTVPNLGAYVGLSVNYQNAKISFGYRADEFFGAMDGGIDTYKSENRGFFGPYANISIGLGG